MNELKSLSQIRSDFLRLQKTGEKLFLAWKKEHSPELIWKHCVGNALLGDTCAVFFYPKQLYDTHYRSLMYDIIKKALKNDEGVSIVQYEGSFLLKWK